MSDKVIYKHIWQQAELCLICGEDLGSSAVNNYFNAPCPDCGSVSALCPESVTTSKRFCVTYKPNIFLRLIGFKEKGYYEWSGKAYKFLSDDNFDHVVSLQEGRVLAPNIPITIVASGVASGLF